MLEEENSQTMNFSKVEELFNKITAKMTELPEYIYKNLTIFIYFIIKKYYKWKINHDKEMTAKDYKGRPNQKFLEESYKYLQYESAVYAKLGFALFYPSDIIMSKEFYNMTDLEAMSKHVDIPLESINDSHTEGEKGHPKYFITKDEKIKKIVLSIRGTMEYNDAIIDLCGEIVPLMYMGMENIWTHEGIYWGVKALYETVKDVLNNLVNENKTNGYELVITGHSLGGGSSLLMYLFLRDLQYKKEFPDIQIWCYAFAPPPIFAPLNKLLPEHSKDIFTFVNDNDIVPRLSTYDVFNFCKMMRMIDQIECNITITDLYIHRNYKRYIYAKSGFNKLKDYSAEKYKEMSEWSNNNWQYLDKEYNLSNSWTNAVSYLSGAIYGSKEEEQPITDTTTTVATTETKTTEQNESFRSKFSAAISSYFQSKKQEEAKSNEYVTNLLNSNYDSSTTGGNSTQFEEFKKLEQDVDNQNNATEEKAESYKDTYLRVEKELERMFIDIKQKRKDIIESKEIPNLQHIGYVYWIFEDSTIMNYEIKQVSGEHFDEILMHPMNTDDHMNGKYERHFRYLMGTEKFEYKKKAKELIE